MELELEVEVEIELVVLDVVLLVLCVVSVTSMYFVAIGVPPPGGTTSTSVTYKLFGVLNTFELVVTGVDVDGVGGALLVPELVLEPEKGTTVPSVIRFVGVAEELLPAAGVFGAGEEVVVYGSLGGEFLNEVGSFAWPVDRAVVGFEEGGLDGEFLNEVGFSAWPVDTAVAGFDEKE